MLRLILKEILHRKTNFLLSLLAMVTAVALFVCFFTTGQASQRETARLMRDMGFNLRIIPKGTDLSKFWATGMSERTMPEDYVHRFASQAGLSYTHLLATLQKQIQWHDHAIILTGLASEISPPDKRRPSMVFSIQRGTIHVGHVVADRVGLNPGDQVELLGTSFTVAGRLSETGSADDIRVYAHLRDVQDLLGLKGRINEIKALECLCRDPNQTSLEILRQQLTELIPEAEVIQIANIARAREKQRLMTERQFAFVMPFVVIVCAAWIGVLAMLNVRDRQQEIGILRALGYRSGKIAVLFLGRAALIGLLGALVGFFIGTQLSLHVAPHVFEVTARSVQPIFALLLWSLLLAPGFAALSSFIPATIAITQDPAVVLREK